MDASDHAVEFSKSGSSKECVTQWCGEYLVTRVSGVSQRDAVKKAHTAAGTDAAPSKVLGKLMCSSRPTQQAHVKSMVVSVVLAWLTALATYKIAM